MDREKGHLGKPVATTCSALRIKILTLGEAAVGKSCLIKRYCEGRVECPPIWIDYGVKGVTVGDQEVKVNFWDVAGDPAYYEVRNEFYRDSQGVILVFDVGSRRTLEALDAWYAEFSRYVDDKMHVVLVGNKAENPNRTVSEAEGRQWAEKMGYPYFETSASSGRGVPEMFDSLFTKVVQLVRGSK